MGKEPSVRRFLGGPRYAVEEIRRGLVERKGWLDSLYIVETPQGDSIGYAGIVENRDIGEGDIDFLVALLPEHQNKGYGAEILDVLRNRWLTEVGRDYCTASVWPENESAVKILQKRGFRQVGEYTDRFGHLRHIYRYDKVKTG
jgi:RimJ/RimL family protein N-acetyltransferase